MKTRTEYMNTLPKYGTPESMAHHRAYYAQFVTQAVKDRVARTIGLDALKQSRDPHFNDIPLARWDSLHLVEHTGGDLSCNGLPASCFPLMREAGEGNSASTGTCICKEAARQLVEEDAQ